MSASAFVHPVRARFGDCDPAGIVYFPVIHDWFHQAMEAWFDDGLGVPYRAMIEDRRVGLPAVHSEADFRAPCRLGDLLAVGLSVDRIGERSIDLVYALTGEAPDDIRATGRTVVCTVDLDTMEAVPVPDDLRERMIRFIPE